MNTVYGGNKFVYHVSCSSPHRKYFCSSTWSIFCLKGTIFLFPARNQTYPSDILKSQNTFQQQISNSFPLYRKHLPFNTYMLGTLIFRVNPQTRKLLGLEKVAWRTWAWLHHRAHNLCHTFLTNHKPLPSTSRSFNKNESKLHMNSIIKTEAIEQQDRTVLSSLYFDTKQT